jgi:dTDP-4-dehydrorhamnose reductase
MAMVDTPIELPAVLHWSDAGAASWYDVALAVGELGVELRLLERLAQVIPITSAEYPTPAQRQSYSLQLGLPALHCRQALRELLEALR